jgi:hypothetical protein
VLLGGEKACLAGRRASIGAYEFYTEEMNCVHPVERAVVIEKSSAGVVLKSAIDVRATSFLDKF